MKELSVVAIMGIIITGITIMGTGCGAAVGAVGVAAVRTSSQQPIIAKDAKETVRLLQKKCANGDGVSCKRLKKNRIPIQAPSASVFKRAKQPAAGDAISTSISAAGH